MTFNEKLKFSWGHIITFVAMITISYFSFLGLTYLTDGNFISSGIGVAAIDLIITFFFIGPQILKSTDHNFKKRIIFERILLVAAPIVLVAAMYPACHFWTVFDNRTNIENSFKESVTSVKDMFEQYEEYANNRISAYDGIVDRQKTTAVNKQDQKLSLKLQLLDANYYTLKSEATEWIDRAKGSTVWNVFLIANIKTIKDAINDWNSMLRSFSENTVKYEPNDIIRFDAQNESLNAILWNLDKIKTKYSVNGVHITLYAIIMVILCYILLMFPYVIQERNTKSTYHLFFNENKGKKNLTFNTQNRSNDHEHSESVRRDIEPNKPINKPESNNSEEDDDFEAFTM